MKTRLIFVILVLMTLGKGISASAEEYTGHIQVQVNPFTDPSLEASYIDDASDCSIWFGLGDPQSQNLNLLIGRNPHTITRSDGTFSQSFTTSRDWICVGLRSVKFKVRNYLTHPGRGGYPPGYEGELKIEPLGENTVFNHTFSYDSAMGYQSNIFHSLIYMQDEYFREEYDYVLPAAKFAQVWAVADERIDNPVPRSLTWAEVAPPTHNSGTFEDGTLFYYNLFIREDIGIFRGIVQHEISHVYAMTRRKGWIGNKDKRSTLGLWEAFANYFPCDANTHHIFTRPSPPGDVNLLEAVVQNPSQDLPVLEEHHSHYVNGFAIAGAWQDIRNTVSTGHVLIDANENDEIIYGYEVLKL